MTTFGRPWLGMDHSLTIEQVNADDTLSTWHNKPWVDGNSFNDAHYAVVNLLSVYEDPF